MRWPVLVWVACSGAGERDEQRTRQKLTIATVDAFQGMEHDVIVVSTVRGSYHPNRNPNPLT